MKATSSRRRIIVAVLLVLALLGAAMRTWAVNPSLTRDVGTLLLVLWLPVIGNIVAFVIAQAHRIRAARRPIAFAAGAPFSAHLQVQLVPVPAGTGGDPLLAAGERTCTLVIGHEGFTARMADPLATWLAAGAAQTIAVELLRPQAALPRLAAGTEFTVFAAGALIGTGRVLRVPA